MADKKMWGGRFSGGTAASMEAYSESVSFDWRLYAEDILGSQAHARMLARQGFLTDDEAVRICDGLDAVRAEIEAGEFVWKTGHEDVHMNIESRLTELIGPLGGKLHTARSRNDQVALDFRLHVAARLAAWQERLAALIKVYADRADEHRDTLLPGCTHFQPAQPVSLAHHLLAYCQMFRRDHERLADCLKRVRVMPLGAAALAGTTHPVDPAFVAQQLGMEAVFANSMDAVADRDFVLEAVFAGSVVMTHLSRMCEEIIIWANPNFGYVRLPDGYSTGSSIMPQKKNPDSCEIMRGKTGRVVGSLMGLLVLVKGLPMTYNRDMQEDKEPFFDADRTVTASLEIMAGLLRELEFVPERMLAAVERGFLNATELADYLAARGLPFREAHHITGAAVGYAESKGVRLEDLSLDEMRRFSALIDEDVYGVLDYRAAVRRRNMPGGTGPQSVAGQITALRTWLGSAG
ncbi:MAG: argininosuccinate lyase [Pseudodesulfovibrio sp.]|uniref:Argininosuccinate lyase n=1 Tax=Pseudodesulfovibrio aespoeensis (strain ATCC 700646 / DSM 10631 / Aspo-2) TaxID=643562 RepID=E6VUM7_PSEA9|nr:MULTISPECIES: argininosuccinate lyase [Pseudodesulfovibrio]MBU4193287.1 argininosuccinate lyase [Pseudomonadota bacterium]ADU62268.1 argininosuccinate lyase [Pseudodesulfovibrio aespoeensis Aspo-2]MBU4243318.1 argininosuccinate lyase [Pseudomonadota bacterium]MBU4380484.1 argininosuccinate lyase [Pseudomonadota bacterium]MBU4474067.1 argininosuccinate lyase [Pseudomonadota bacterium]